MPKISNIEYIIPNADRKLGSLSFNIETPILFEDIGKPLGENPSADIELSAETVELLSQLSKSLIKDLEK